MKPASKPRHLSPARIYVLWHPDFDRPDLKTRDPATLTPEDQDAIDRGLRLARRIYYWFRLENMEGIPVYFRSTNAPGKDQPLPIEEDSAINYIIPLIDANMVSSPEWRDYVARIAAKSEMRSNGCLTQLFPVAVDPVAYNMPESMRRLNFIRHDLSRPPVPDDGILIGQLTEVLCRDMQARVKDTMAKKRGSLSVPGKLKIFLSHAKADDTKEAIALKDFIQSRTQCEAFFDETDIASGYDYANVLEKAITEDSAGLIVIQGDHYADRPWCRKEIRDFLSPVADKVVARSTGSAPAYFIPPVVVVQTMQGNQIARTIPELGHAPCVRWQDDKARFVVRTLLREILLGLFYRLVGRSVADGLGPDCVVINRSPDPVMINRILSAAAGTAANPGYPEGKPVEAAEQVKTRPQTVVHPGYGLSSMEREGLEMSFPGLNFRSFAEVSAPVPALSSGASPAGTDPLEGKLLAVAVGNATDAIDHGISDEHNQELLIRLLRPLLCRQASLLYGGSLPTVMRPDDPWQKSVNFTATFLHLLLSERAAKQQGKPVTSRLYNLSPWPSSRLVTRKIIAQWTDICSFIALSEEQAGIKPPTPSPPAPDERLNDADLSPAQRREIKAADSERLREHRTLELVSKARCLTDMRQRIFRPIRCTLPDKPPGGPRNVNLLTFAHIFIGGKTANSSGIIPGLFEEILHVLEATDIAKPVFIIGQGRGAAGLVARWLTTRDLKKRPKELDPEHYRKTDGDFAAVRQNLEALKEAQPDKILTPDDALGRLWTLIRKARAGGDLGALFRNGLDHEQNRTLLTSGSSVEVCQLVWRGIDNLLEKQS